MDIAGLIKGAAEGAGLGNAFLSHIAAVDGIFHLVRAFDSDEVIHVDDSVDPIRDLETIESELCLKDKETFAIPPLQTVSYRDNNPTSTTTSSLTGV